MEHICDDLLCEILLLVPLSVLSNLRQTCVRFHKFCSRDYFWKRRQVQDYPYLSPTLSVVSYQDYYRLLHRTHKILSFDSLASNHCNFIYPVPPLLINVNLPMMVRGNFLLYDVIFVRLNKAKYPHLTMSGNFIMISYPTDIRQSYIGPIPRIGAHLHPRSAGEVFDINALRYFQQRGLIYYEDVYPSCEDIFDETMEPFLHAHARELGYRSVNDNFFSEKNKQANIDLFEIV